MIKTLFKRLFLLGFITGFIGLAAIAYTVYSIEEELPDFEELKSTTTAQKIRVLDTNGREIVSIGPSFGQWLKYEDIPKIMIDAITSVEDRRFFSHYGVDPRGIARSIYVNTQKGGRVQGASTITQQLTRYLFLNNRKDFTRKIREQLMTLAMEHKFSKAQILELYLNKVYFGGGAFGIDSASRRFFGHGAKQLKIEEAAIIAGLVKAPSRYSPTANEKAAIERASVVLSTMVSNEKLTKEQAKIINLAKVKFAPAPKQNSARYFTDWALPLLDDLIDERTAPIIVHTTLNLDLQKLAANSIVDNIPSGSEGALIAIDKGGEIRSMIGGVDYVKSNYNRSTTAVRQPGSSWKVFVYMAALERGYTPDDIVLDEPVTIANWTPKNSNGRFSGEMSLRSAFAYSKNTVAASLGEEVGTASIANMARRFGIKSPINTSPSMVLGTSEMTVLEMSAAFAGISNQGIKVEPYAIAKVTKIDGQILYAHEKDTGDSVVDEWVSTGIVDLMQTAVATGTGRSAQIGRPVAGKTGTTSSNKDGWFLGFSSGLTTGVWMGRDDAKPVKSLQGGRAPAKAFAQFMRGAVASRPVEQFKTELKLPEWQLDNDIDLFGNSEFTNFSNGYELIDTLGDINLLDNEDADIGVDFDFNYDESAVEDGTEHAPRDNQPYSNHPADTINRIDPSLSVEDDAARQRPNLNENRSDNRPQNQEDIRLDENWLDHVLQNPG